MMQVTTGKAKGRKLKSVPGDSTRPITDRAKQALFNILMDDVRDTVWLDLFAGTGAVGIEALSRGARGATFLDREKVVVDVIAENLRNTGLQTDAKVIRQDAFAYLGGHPNQQYDFIFVAPPQYQQLWAKALRMIDSRIGWLSDNGEVIVQIDPREFESLPLQNLELSEERRYGRTLLCFYTRVVHRSPQSD
jgi:16S rRNA (guanine(966)-N(2))-methyltransferase RsmD